MHQASLDPGVQEGGRPLASPLPRFLCRAEWNPTADPLWQRILTEVAGVNLFGDPMLRIVNGSARLELIGGIWGNVELEDAGLPSARYQWDQKYPWLEEFWLVEEWTPVHLSREAWEAGERAWENGVSFLQHPIYPSRGEYRYFNHFRRKLADGEEEPEAPTSTGLRFLAHAWRRHREIYPPPLLEKTAEERERRMRAAVERQKARRAAKEAAARRAKRDIWENEVGGPTGITPKVSLAGLDLPAN